MKCSNFQVSCYLKSFFFEKSNALMDLLINFYVCGQKKGYDVWPLKFHFEVDFHWQNWNFLIEEMCITLTWFFRVILSYYSTMMKTRRLSSPTLFKNDSKCLIWIFQCTTCHHHSANLPLVSMGKTGAFLHKTFQNHSFLMIDES